MVLTLFVNDPLGKRCRINLEAAMRVKKEYPLEVKVINKSSAEYRKLADPPPCPSVILDGRVIKEYGVVSSDDLKEELLKFIL